MGLLNLFRYADLVALPADVLSGLEPVSGVSNYAQLLAQNAVQGPGLIFIESVKLLLILLAPFVVFALIIHWLERVSQRRLAERFGWRSVLWTGWLGTPIHELSHVFMCRVFGHSVDEIALFEPDEKSGRLGYVRHSFKAGDLYPEVGNLFIGIAPLFAGSIVLAILLWMFYPDAVSAAFESTKVGVSASASDDLMSEIDLLGDTLESGTQPGLEQAGQSESFQQFAKVVTSVSSKILAIENLTSVRFWVFIYLVLCVGSHMAPSRSDYDGTSRGVFIFGGIPFAGVFLLVLLGVDSKQMVELMVTTMGPLFAVLGLAVLLVGMSTAIVYLFTAPIPLRRA